MNYDEALKDLEGLISVTCGGNRLLARTKLALETAKKEHELLELYREHHKLVPFKTGLGDKSKRVCDISIEIKQKEKELEEMK